MTIYGVAILGFCYLLGRILGELLGHGMGIEANVGGVGFSMILLILVTHWLHERKGITTTEEGGIIFWSNLYIPVIVAMSSIQNVKGALSGGWIAILAGTVPVFTCFLLVPWLSGRMRPKPPSK